MRIKDIINNLLYLKNLIKLGRKATVSIAEETIDEAVRHLSFQTWTPLCVSTPKFEERPDGSLAGVVGVIVTVPGPYTRYLKYCRREIRGRIVERFEDDNGIYHGPVYAWMYLPEPWNPEEGVI